MNNAVLGMACLIFLISVKNSETASTGNDQWAYDYCDIKCNGTLHTMCHYPAGGGDSCHNNLKVYLTKAEKVYIEDNLNRIRGLVATGEESGLPQASNMMKLVWDRELMTIAKRWADQCNEGLHDECRKTSDEMDTGQTVYIGHYKQHSKGTMKMERIKKILEKWEGERKAFNPMWLDHWDPSAANLTGNYSQIIWATTDLVGCGYTEFQMKDYVMARLVCNYKRMGNVPDAPVYRVGKPCSSCPLKTQCSDTYKGMCWNGKFSNYTDLTDDGNSLRSSLVVGILSFTVLMIYS